MADKIRVLYVDDENGLLEIAKHYLEKDGTFTIDILTSAKLALIQLNTERYDAIISDYQMPGMDGITFLKQLKASGNNIPFIIFTGRGREEVVIEALNNGADFYIQKGGDPISQFAELSNKIQYAITRKRAEKQLLEKNEELKDSYEQISAAEEELRGQFDMLVKNEKDLRESEERYRLISENTADVIWTLSYKTGKFTYVSPSVQKLRGYTPEEVMTQTMAEALTPESMEKVNRLIREGIAKRKPGDTSRHIMTNLIDQPCKDGSVVSTEVVSTLVFDEKGNPVEFFGISRDITERKVAEEALRESEIKYRTLFDNSSDAILIHDMTGKILDVNRVLCDRLGYSKEELLQMSPMDFDSPEYAEQVPERIRQLMEKKHQIFETCNVRKDKTRIPTEINVRIIDYEGEQVCLTVGRDITERKRAEAALQRQSATLSILNGIISTANKADNLPQLLSSILEESLHLLDFDAGGIYLVDHSTRTAKVVHSKNISPDLLAEIQTLPIDKKPYDTLFIKNEPIITEDYAKIAPALSKKFGFQSIASIPLLSKGVAIGALNIASKRRHVITDEEKQTLISISQELGSTIERMAAEEEVRKTVKNLKTLFNSIDEMVFVLNMQGNILAVNDTVQKRLLYTSEELIGTNVLQLHVPERRDEALRIVQGMIDGTIDSCPVPVLAKDSTRIEVETKVTRGWWNGNEALIGVSRDITERKVSERKFAAAFEASPDPIAITDIQTGIILDINSAFEKWSGYLLDEISGKTTSDLNFWVYPEERDTFVKLLKTQGSVHKKEVTFRKKNGETRDILFSANVFGTENKTFMLSLAEDITDRKRSEEMTRENLEHFRTIINSMQFGIFIIDAKTHTIVEANVKALEMIGGTSESVLGSVCHRFICPAELGKCPVTDLLQTVDSSERVLLNLRGEKIPILKSVIKTVLGGKEVLIESFINITDRKLAEDTILRVNLKLNVLSQLTRQDLTTQIFILNSYLEIAKKQATGQDGIIKNIESGERAVRSIKEITEFTKDYQNMGEKPPKYQNVKLVFLFGLSHISIGGIQHSVETENLEIFADPLLEKAFQGLLENSVAHGDHVSLIRVSHTITTDEVTIVFEDNGIGIPNEKKERIFLRGEGARASVRGLFFVREILDITGITIRETGEPGKGTRFEMTVPKGAWRLSDVK